MSATAEPPPMPADAADAIVTIACRMFSCGGDEVEAAVYLAAELGWAAAKASEARS